MNMVSNKSGGSIEDRLDGGESDLWTLNIFMYMFKFSGFVTHSSSRHVIYELLFEHIFMCLFKVQFQCCFDALAFNTSKNTFLLD